MAAYLPSHPGLLPYWQLLLSILAIFNTTIVYASKSNALLTYAGPKSASQVTDLASRLLGTWNALAAVVRFYAAYNIDNEVAYTLSIWTFVIALVHFLSEWLVFGTTKPGPGMWRVLPFPIVSLIWMLLQWDYYVKG